MPEKRSLTAPERETLSATLHEIAREGIPDDMNLMPEIEARIARLPARAARSRLSWMLAMIGVMLFFSAAVYAVDRLLQNARDPGLIAAGEADLLTIIEETQIIDGVSVTLHFVYADANRISLDVSARGEAPPPIVYTLGESRLTDAEGRAYESIFGGGGGGGGGGGATDPNAPLPFHTSQTISFDVPFEELPAALDLSFEVDLIRSDMTTNETVGTAVYTFTVPVLAGRVYAPDVPPEQTINNITVRFERFTVTPSLARGRVCIIPIDELRGERVWYLNSVLRLNGDAISADQNLSASELEPDQLRDAPEWCYNIHFSDAYYDLDPTGDGMWEIEFTSLYAYHGGGFSMGISSSDGVREYTFTGDADLLTQVQAALEESVIGLGLNVPVEVITENEPASGLRIRIPPNTTVDPEEMDAAFQSALEDALCDTIPLGGSFAFTLPPAN